MNNYKSQFIPRDKHAVSRADISENALKVLYRLHHAGYQACLVGGGVRDLLLNSSPKDFDVATNARPEEVRDLFSNCRLIGRRFRLAHVHFERDIVEVATFRRAPSPDDENEEIASNELVQKGNGLIIRDNVFGSLEEDAWRRDFTVNALYYDISDFSLIDHVGALDDLKQGIIRLMGDPDERYREDPVRMLRAIRFAAKLGFDIEERTAKPIYELGQLLNNVPAARLYEEVLKLFHTGHAFKTYQLLREYNLLATLFPLTEAFLQQDTTGIAHRFIEHALENTDSRIREDKPVSPAFLYAVFLWFPLLKQAFVDIGSGAPSISALQKEAANILAQQGKYTAIPRRVSSMLRDVWFIQPRMERYGGLRALQLLLNQRFRAGYDFLFLRATAGENIAERCQWWTDVQDKPAEEQKQMALSLPNVGRKRRSRRRARKSA